MSNKSRGPTVAGTAAFQFRTELGSNRGPLGSNRANGNFGSSSGRFWVEIDLSPPFYATESTSYLSTDFAESIRIRRLESWVGNRARSDRRKDGKKGRTVSSGRAACSGLLPRRILSVLRRERRSSRTSPGRVRTTPPPRGKRRTPGCGPGPHVADGRLVDRIQESREASSGDFWMRSLRTVTRTTRSDSRTWSSTTST